MIRGGAAAVCAAACSSVDLAKRSTSSASDGPNGNPVLTEVPGVGAAGVGSVGMHLDIGTPPNGATVFALNWTISNGTNTYAGTSTVGDAQSFEFVEGGIAAGTGYTVTLSGSDTAGDPCGAAAGPAGLGTSSTFSVTARSRFFGGQLYGVGDTTQTPEVFTVGTGLPQTGPLPAPELPGLPAVGSAGLWSFAIFDLNPSVSGVDTLYLASSTVVNLGDAGSLPMGILKFTFDGSKWSFASAFGPASGARGLAGLANPATNSVTLITSTVETGSTTNHVDVFVDNGGTVTAGPAIQSTTNTLSRGVAIAPHN